MALLHFYYEKQEAVSQTWRVIIQKKGGYCQQEYVSCLSAGPVGSFEGFGSVFTKCENCT